MNLWTRLGISTALAAIYCIVVTAFLRDSASYDRVRWCLSGGLAVAAVVLWICGRLFPSVPMVLPSEDQDELAGGEADLPSAGALVSGWGYWALMALLFSLITLAIPPEPKPVPVQALSKPVKRRPAEPTNSPALASGQTDGCRAASRLAAAESAGHKLSPEAPVRSSERAHFVCRRRNRTSQGFKIGPECVIFEMRGQYRVVDLPK